MNDLKAIANSIALSELFSMPRGSSEKLRLESHSIPAPPHHEVKVSGWRLGEPEREVYSRIMSHPRGCRRNELIHFRVKDFLLGMCMEDNAENRIWLWNSIDRMGETFLSITEALPGRRKKGFACRLFTLSVEGTGGLPEEIWISVPLESLMSPSGPEGSAPDGR